jgi:hypothetical protein
MTRAEIERAMESWAAKNPDLIARDDKIYWYAKTIGVSQRTVHRWLSGEARPHQLAMEKINKLA